MGPLGEVRLNVTVYEVYEFTSIMPILTGVSAVVPSSAAGVHAMQVAQTIVRQDKGANHKRKNNDSSLEYYGKKLASKAWKEREAIANAAVTYGPIIAEYAMEAAALFA